MVTYTMVPLVNASPVDDFSILSRLMIIQWIRLNGNASTTLWSGALGSEIGCPKLTAGKTSKGIVLLWSMLDIGWRVTDVECCWCQWMLTLISALEIIGMLVRHTVSSTELFVPFRWSMHKVVRWLMAQMSCGACAAYIQIIQNWQQRVNGNWKP